MMMNGTPAIICRGEGADRRLLNDEELFMILPLICGFKSHSSLVAVCPQQVFRLLLSYSKQVYLIPMEVSGCRCRVQWDWLAG